MLRLPYENIFGHGHQRLSQHRAAMGTEPFRAILRGTLRPLALAAGHLAAF